jgi:hypothetical protein
MKTMTHVMKMRDGPRMKTTIGPRGSCTPPITRHPFVWKNGELEVAGGGGVLTEQDAMEAVLDEMEEEPFTRIHVLEAQVMNRVLSLSLSQCFHCMESELKLAFVLQLKALKQESMRVKEHRGKARWDKSAEDARHRHSNKVGGEEALKQQEEAAVVTSHP